MENKQFKPFVPAERVMPEFTVFSIVLGIILAVVFGGANAYLGLRIGTTISASIPAAVLSMGVMRIIFKRDSILENNMAQTIGSAGESLAAGAIFTIPALFMWASEGLTDMPSVVDISLIAICGGVDGYETRTITIGMVAQHEEHLPGVTCKLLLCKTHHTLRFGLAIDNTIEQHNTR